MKKVMLIVIMMMFIASPGFGKISQQMGGRISPNSPIDFNAGKNKIHFYSEGLKVVGNLYVPGNHTKGEELAAIVVVGPKGIGQRADCWHIRKKTIGKRLYNSCY